MKKIYFLLTLCMLAFVTYAQVGITDIASEDFDTTPVDQNAVLELRSNNKGLLFPRLTTTVIDALTDVTPGTMVYDITVNCFKGYNGTRWWPMGDDCETGPNTPPVASNVVINNAEGNAVTQIQVGQTVTGNYTFTDANGDSESGSTFQWESALDASGLFHAPITNANSISYTPQTSDVGSFIGFCVTPSDGTDAGSRECTTQFVEVVAAPLPNGRINELHYDNDSTDANEFIEVRLTNADAGAVSEYSVQFTNEDGTDYGSAISLSSFVVGVNTGTYTYYSNTFATNGINNQGKGIKLIQNGTTIDYVSYEVDVVGATRIVNQAGAPIREDGNTSLGSSIQKSPSANYWFTTDGFNTKGEPNSDTQNLNPTVQFSEATASVGENGGAYMVTLNVTNPGAEAIQATITATTGNGATAGDYTTTLSSPVTIAAGATSATFTITGVDDTDTDPNETVTFNITGVSASTESPVVGAIDELVVTITDDETPVAGCTTPINLIEFGFDGDTGDAVTKAANTLDNNISSAIISRGTGLTAAGNDNRFNATGGDAASLADAITANDYFDITYEIATGATINLDAFNFNWDRSNTGAPNVAIKSSVDGYTTVLDTFTGLNGGANSNADLSSYNILQDLSGTVSFRVYAWGGTSAGGSFGFEGDGRDILIIGCVNSGTPTTDPTVQFSEATASVGENGGAYTVTLNVSNPGAEAIQATITATTGNGASAGDYTTTLSSPVTIAAGATSATFTITGVDDTDTDPNETVTFNITGVSSATESPVVGAIDELVVTITDDESPTPPASCKTDLLFTEYYDGSSSNKYVEIYNGTGASVDLATYTIELYTNGSATVFTTLDLTGNLADDTTYVIGNSQATDYSGYDITSGVANFNGDDILVLTKSGNVLDRIGPAGNANNNNILPTDGVLLRNADAQPNATYTDTEWTEVAISANTLGSYTCTGGSTPTTGATVSFDTTSISFSEGTGIAEVPINFTNNTGNDVTVNISASANPLSLNLEGNTFVIPASSTAGTYDFTIEWTDNSTNDGDVNFTLDLATGTDYTVGTNASNTVTITEDDGTPANIEVLNITQPNIINDWSTYFSQGTNSYLGETDGGLRFGSGSKGASITTISPITFTGSTGTVIVTIDVKGWDSNEKEGIITVGSDSYTFNVSVDKDDANAETVTHTFTGVPTGSNVTFETTNNNGNDRFIIYNILIEKQN